MNFTILRFDSLGSTNTEAANQARQGGAEGVCVVADEQTGGRGRQGRSWTSEKGAGLYMSVVLRPRLAARYLSLITLAGAVAVHDVLREGFLIPADIKWPNDILVEEKKICGILAETVETGAGVAIILGIGINLRTPDGEKASSISAASTFGTTRDELLAAVLEGFAVLYEELHIDPAKIVAMWTERSSFSSGLEVEATLANETIRGTTDGLEETGALRVKLADGSVTAVHAGDVQRLRGS